jgi:hypothetical protein
VCQHRPVRRRGARKPREIREIIIKVPETDTLSVIFWIGFIHGHLVFLIGIFGITMTSLAKYTEPFSLKVIFSALVLS